MTTITLTCQRLKRFPFFFSCVSKRSNFLAWLICSEKLLGSVLCGLQGSLCGDLGRFPAADRERAQAGWSGKPWLCLSVCLSCDGLLT